jgi:hypothetical protein
MLSRLTGVRDEPPDPKRACTRGVQNQVRVLFHWQVALHPLIVVTKSLVKCRPS